MKRQKMANAFAMFVNKKNHLNYLQKTNEDGMDMLQFASIAKEKEAD